MKVNGTIKNTFKITTDYSTGYFTYTISLSKNDVLSFEIPSSSTTGYKNDNAISIVAQVASWRKTLFNATGDQE